MTVEAAPAVEPAMVEPVRRIGARTFDFSQQVAVMKIVNRTPDSAFDSGATFALEAAVRSALTAAEAGADWVDIGGEAWATTPVSEAEEIDRVLPVVERVRAESDVVISVDTYRPEVARLAIAAGANVINDASGLHHPELAEVVAAGDAQLVVTHAQRPRPGVTVIRPTYAQVTEEVIAFLRERVATALSRGVRPGRLIVDPGHDLNKNTHHSLEITRRLSEIASIGYPTLVATSKKHFIGETLDRRKSERRDGTVATLVFCILRGARIVRVHDEGPALDAVRMTEAMLGWREPILARHNVEPWSDDLAARLG